MRRLSEVERSEIWDRFEAGESQWSISRRLGRSPSSIRTHLVSTGFRRPVPAGDWSSFRLSLTEREEISRGLAAGESMRCIASRLGRVGSTVSREVASNGGRLKYSSDVSASGVSTPGPKTETSNGCFQPRVAWSGGGQARGLVVTATNIGVAYGAIP